MSFKDFYRREKYVALNAQPRKFRIAKWIILVAVAFGLYVWGGWLYVALLALFCAVAGTIVHFLLRYKTDGWSKSWGPYTHISLDGE